MSTDKRIIITKDGNIQEILPYSEANISKSLNAGENISVVPAGVYLSSELDSNKESFKSIQPQNVKVTKNKINQISLAGPSSYDIPQRLPNVAETTVRLILGGQHSQGNTLSGIYFPRGNQARYIFDHDEKLDDLKLLRGDHFQILNTNISVLDGIYKVIGRFDNAFNTLKVQGNTAALGASGSFSFGGSSGPFPMIRLQAVDGTSFGLSADVDGCGTYQIDEAIEQSVYKVNNNGGVVHSNNHKKLGSSSAEFSGVGAGSTGPFLSIDSEAGFAFDNSSKYYFRLSTFVKHDVASPSADRIIVAKKGKTSTSGNGPYMLKYETSPKSYVFAFTTNQSGNLGKTITATVPLISLTGFHHVQVDIGDVEGRIFINGELKAVTSLGATEEIFQDNVAPFLVGAEDDGTSAFAGFIDEVDVRYAKASTDGATAMMASAIIDPLGTTGAASTLNVGITIPVPTTGNTGERHTQLLIRADGLSGCQRFVERGENVTEGTVQAYDANRRILHVTNFGFTGSATGFDTTKGFIKGFDIADTGQTAGITGNSQSVYPLLDVSQGITKNGLTFSQYINTINGNQTIVDVRYLYSNAMSGDSGDFGNFPTLFSSGAGTGGTFDDGTTSGKDSLIFFATDGNVARVEEIERLVGISAGQSGDVFHFIDANGISFGVRGSVVDEFLTDITIYRNIRREASNEVRSELGGKTSLKEARIGGKSGVIKTENVTTTFSVNTTTAESASSFQPAGKLDSSFYDGL